MEVEAVVLKSLAKDSQERFESVQAFALALERAYLVGEEVTAMTQRSSSPLPIVAQENPPITISSQTAESKQLRLSRRAILLGLSGVAIAGGITYFSFADSKKIKVTAAHSPPPVTHPLKATLVNTFKGHKYAISDLDWSPDGKLIASASYDESVKIWDATTGNHVVFFPYVDNYAFSAKFLPGSGARIASGSGKINVKPVGSVKIWDAARGTLLYTYTGHTDRVTAIAWSPDSKYLASGGNDNDPTVHVWTLS
ncbi:MAG TPA: hypothetical protein VGT44_06185 [Ktedonobacteraceae bacterium]|nr:hypothetical protein [Ktedonobacteraceae bacterium]